MKIVYYRDSKIQPTENKKHVIHFFGMLGCIKIDIFGNSVSQEENSKLVRYYFEYPYFSRVVNPELFQKELNDEEKKFNRRILSLWLCFAILSTASIVSLYLAYQNQKSKKVLTGLAFASVVLSILATVCFVVVCLWMFFNFIKERFVIHKMKSFLENEVSSERIKCYKKELIGENQVVNAEIHKQELEKDIAAILEFFLKRRNIITLYRFLTNGEELIQAGMGMVNMLLINGIHPNNIILDTNSLGGGVAAEVLKRFEDHGIYLTIIHSNSYSSLKSVIKDSPYSLFRWLPPILLNNWLQYCELDFNPLEVIKNTKCPALIVGRKGDAVIPEALQLVGKLDDQSTNERLRKNIVLEHNPVTSCDNKNIHTDHKEHLIYRQDNGNAIGYEEKEKQFIEEAYKYLTDHKLNNKFDQERYIGNNFSKNLTEIELELIDKRCMQV